MVDLVISFEEIEIKNTPVNIPSSYNKDIKLLWKCRLSTSHCFQFSDGIGAMTGFGIATIMTPVLLLFLPLPETLLLVGIIHVFGSLWQVLLFREGIMWRLLLAFGAPGIITSFIGASISLDVPKEILSRALGGFLIIYVLFILVNPRFRLQQRTLTASAGGASYGFLAGIFGIGGAVRGMFLSAFDLPKAVYIATS